MTHLFFHFNLSPKNFKGSRKKFFLFSEDRSARNECQNRTAFQISYFIPIIPKAHYAKKALRFTEEL